MFMWSKGKRQRRTGKANIKRKVIMMTEEPSSNTAVALHSAEAGPAVKSSVIQEASVTRYICVGRDIVKFIWE